jgi:hypothetical protein
MAQVRLRNGADCRDRLAEEEVVHDNDIEPDFLRPQCCVAVSSSHARDNGGRYRSPRPERIDFLQRSFNSRGARPTGSQCSRSPGNRSLEY